MTIRILLVVLLVLSAFAGGVGYARAEAWLDAPLTCGLDSVAVHPVGRQRNAADHLPKETP